MRACLLVIIVAGLAAAEEPVVVEINVPVEVIGGEEVVDAEARVQAMFLDRARQRVVVVGQVTELDVPVEEIESADPRPPALRFPVDGRRWIPIAGASSASTASSGMHWRPVLIGPTGLGRAVAVGSGPERVEATPAPDR